MDIGNNQGSIGKRPKGGKNQKVWKYKSWKCFLLFYQQFFIIQLPNSNNYIS